MTAAMPPRFWASAMTWSASVVFPDDFRPVNLDDPPPGDAADPQGDVEGQGAGRDHLDVELGRSLAKPHDRSFSVSFFDLH